MDFYTQRSELEQFLCDVRDHFRASLETSEYENTSNMFHMTAAEMTARLLLRCEQLLNQCSTAATHHNVNATSVNDGASTVECTKSRYASQTATTPTMATAMAAMITAASGTGEDVAYLDMSAKSKKKSVSREYMDLTSSTHSDKTFRCSTRNAEHRYSTAKDGHTTEEGDNDDDDNDVSNTNSGEERRNAGTVMTERDESDDDERQIYDICQVSQVDADETQRAFAPDLELGQSVSDCPYVDLPAGHLIIQQSSKYGQLQRIEKRLFFDQSKKCYCGILNDWLLCYADGPTASRPSIMLHLKGNGIEIEHSGEGKRREVCFQITTAADSSKKYVFQANNEVDAKEWIHAIEAAIRGDTAAVMKNARKLPTPPVLKKLSFVGGMGGGGGVASSQAGDCIYEEPSSFYNVPEPSELLIGRAAATAKRHQECERAPELPDKANHPLDLVKQFEYDVPKSPPQPLQPEPLTLTLPVSGQTESETAGLLNTSESNGSPAKASAAAIKAAAVRSAEKSDFQSKVKDVHSKLTSQLSAGGTPPERLKKAAKKTYSGSSTDSEALSLTIPPPSAKELKKQKKSNTPAASPQKPNTNTNTNGNTNSNSNNCSPNSSSSEKSSKNWFLNRLNKTTSSARSSALLTPPKCKQSEKENLLNSLDVCDGYDITSNGGGGGGQSSNPASPILKSPVGGGGGGGSATVVGGKSKVNMIINQFESSGHHLSMFSMEALAGNAVASFNSFCASDCNNYEPIMTVSTPPSSFMKKV